MHILTKCTVQESKFPVKISSGSVGQRDLIPALKVNINICCIGTEKFVISQRPESLKSQIKSFLVLNSMK
jgi:hypothetical protein